MGAVLERVARRWSPGPFLAPVPKEKEDEVTKEQPPRAIVLLSGGMDSTTLLYGVRSQGYEITALSVHYGQRHKKELEFAMGTTRKLGIDHRLIDLAFLGQLGGSALTDSTPVPEGHYTAANMAQTVVPNRNAILLSMAFALAISRQAKMVCTAVHAGDHAIYPDCRPEFILSFEEMERQAIDREIYGIAPPLLYAPYLKMTKAEICSQGQFLQVPWEDTWSCYQGEEIHCGRCGTCVERIEAFKLAKVVDPTRYEDQAFAEKVLEEEKK